MHRWMWDLHYATPSSSRSEYPISAIPGDTPKAPQGPLALPGNYTVKLTVNNRTYSEPLLVKMDPRVKTSPEGLAQMFQVESRLSRMLNESARGSAEARSAHEQLGKLAKSASGTVAEAISAFDKKVSGVLGGGGPRGGGAASPTIGGVNGDIGALYAEVDRADSIPTVAQVNAVTELEKKLAGVMKQWMELKGSDLPALNEQLRRASLAEIRLESNTAQEDESEDIE